MTHKITVNVISQNRCLWNGLEYQNGDAIQGDECTKCVCYFGEVLCHQAKKCPIPKPGCFRASTVERGACCARIICDKTPTVVLDRIDVATPNTPTFQPYLPPITVADGVVTPDPFRDVIRTEPAPDLPALIGDIMPYLLERQSISTTPMAIIKNISFPISYTESSSTTPTDHTTVLPPSEVKDIESIEKLKESANDNKEDDIISEFSFDKVLQFLFSRESYSSSASTLDVPKFSSFEIPQPAKNYTKEIGNSTEHSLNQSKEREHSISENLKDENIAHTIPKDQSSNDLPHPNLTLLENSFTSGNLGSVSGILKLAGCNIYGRMYRVGLKITELSGPCLECMCTNTGVQCKQLDC